MQHNQNLKETFRAEIPGFAEKARAFAAGEIDRKAYKGISGGFGSYAQRGETGNMLRLRLPGGRVTKQQLAFLAIGGRAQCPKNENHHLPNDSAA